MQDVERVLQSLHLPIGLNDASERLYRFTPFMCESALRMQPFAASVLRLRVVRLRVD